MEIPERSREPLDILEGGCKDDFEEKVNPFHEAGNYDDGYRGGLEGAVRFNFSISSLDLNIPPEFDRCLEDDCEICFGVEKFLVKVFSDSKEKVSSKNLLKQGGLEDIIEDDKEILNYRDQVDGLETDNSEHVDFHGVDAFNLQIAKSFIDLVNLLSFGLKVLWVARLSTKDNWNWSKKIKYSKYLFLWSGKVQFQGQSSIDSLCKRSFYLDSFQQKVGIRGRILHNPVKLMRESKPKAIPNGGSIWGSTTTRL
ncbi:hypothetical protein ACE6H2_026326 [Prunus campanulata]